MTSIRMQVSLVLALAIISQGLGCYRRTVYCSLEFPCDPGYSCDVMTRLCGPLGDGATVDGLPGDAMAVPPPACTQFSQSPQALPIDTSLLTTGSNYGQAIAISSMNWVAIGAPGLGQSASGAVDLYSFGAGLPMLNAAPPLVGFPGGSGAGSALAFSADGKTLFVGAPQDGAGKVYVYQWTGSSWQATPGPIQTSQVGTSGFGQALATAGDDLVVGAPGSNMNSGAVFTFSVASPWSPKGATLPGAAGEYFGAAVALAAGRLLVGAPNPGKGLVHAFISTGGDWKSVGLDQGSLVLAGSARFGTSIAMTDNAALVGAPSDGGGSVAFFTWSSTMSAWVYQSSLPNSGGASGDSFGAAVALYGTSALVGATDAMGSVGRGSLYFRSMGWGAPIDLNTGAAPTYLGSAAAISSKLAIIGATATVVGGSAKGRAFSYACSQ